jgi:3-oxoacyl-(acyl-carrier-protein) synthase
MPDPELQSSSAQRLSAQGFTGSAGSILASRISYFLNLQGPCLAIDTACSSSLVAISKLNAAVFKGHAVVHELTIPREILGLCQRQFH